MRLDHRSVPRKVAEHDLRPGILRLTVAGSQFFWYCDASTFFRVLWDEDPTVSVKYKALRAVALNNVDESPGSVGSA